jgi:menaquinol-cytochrome c reductase iron-sulfur subunit
MKSVSPPLKQSAGTEAKKGETRRSWLDKVGVGVIVAAVAGQAYALLRSLAPNVLYEPAKRFKAGAVDQFPEGATFLEDKRLFIFREQRSFYAISAVCTHLGCTVKLVNLNQPQRVTSGGRAIEEQREFHCPCHGSKYYADGTNYAGPAPRPLAWHPLEVSPDDGQLVVNLGATVTRDFRLRV